MIYSPGLKNGQLLTAAEKESFDVMVTGDLSLTYQQNMVGRKIAIVSLSAIGCPVIGAFVRPGRRPKGPIFD